MKKLAFLTALALVVFGCIKKHESAQLAPVLSDETETVSIGTPASITLTNATSIPSNIHSGPVTLTFGLDGNASNPFSIGDILVVHQKNGLTFLLYCSDSDRNKFELLIEPTSGQ